MEPTLDNNQENENSVEGQVFRSLTKEEGRLHNVANEMINYYVKNYYPSRFEIIKAKHLFAGDEKQAVRDTLQSSAFSCTRHGLIDSVHDAFTKELINQNYTPKMIPLHPCKREYSNDAQEAYDWMYHRSRFESNVSEKAYSEAALIGDSYVFFGKQKKDGYEVPTAEHISFFEMFLEPMATCFEDSRYKLVRKIMHSTDVMKKYNNFIDWDAQSDIGEGLTNREVIGENVESSLYPTDFTKIWDIAFYENAYCDAIQSCCNGVDKGGRRQAINQYLETGQCYEDLFGIDGESNLCEVIEIWHKTMDGHNVKVLINGYQMHDDDIEIDYDPFGNIFFEENIGSPIHRGIGHKLLPRQRECDLLLFSLNNSIKMHVFPDWICDSGVVDATDNPVTQLIWSGEQKVYKNDMGNMKSNQPFKPIEYVKQDVINLIRLRLSEAVATAFQEIGINSYVMGADGRVERVSAAFKARMEQARARLKTIKASIAKCLNKSYYIWLNILDGKFSEKLLERIGADGESSLLDLDISEINNNFEVQISSEGYREDTLKDIGQNILNAVNGMGDFLLDEKTGKLGFDKKKFACGLMDAFGLEGLEFYTDKEELDNHEKELEFMFKKAIIDKKWADKYAAEFPNEQPQPGPGGELPQGAPAGGGQVLDGDIITDGQGQQLGDILIPQEQSQV